MIAISDHAYKQSKKRLSWSKTATKRMASKAFNEGTVVSSDKSKKCVFFNDIVYVFRDSCLLTIYKAGKNIKGNVQNLQT